MYKAQYFKYTLKFIKPSGTSRGVLRHKPTWFIKVFKKDSPIVFGIGECGPIEGLSVDPTLEMDKKLNEVVENINKLQEIDISDFPSIKFGLETAFKDLNNKGERTIFKNDFNKGLKHIHINGLIWMGESLFMKNQIKEKLDHGFSCLKLKIGALNFKDEFSILKNIRNEFSKDNLELRVDANGAFNPSDAIFKLDQLSKLDIHSIEQPIATNQYEEMKQLCAKSPVPIALDEELIKVRTKNEKENLISFIKPQYLILKPSLLGGFQETKGWIEIAKNQNINWWITSALESNIGLNAIAQYCSEFKLKLPQGLGTGNLYKNNITSPLTLDGELLYYDIKKDWELNNLFDS
tara:strand:- start:2768 stop:3817 length:1050 start_codon:yes stop_codon:yes gene_type:complete